MMLAVILIRIRRYVAPCVALAVLAILGRRYPPFRDGSLAAWMYWIAWAELTGIWLVQSVLRPLAARWRMDAQLRGVLPGLGGELNGLKAAAMAIKQGHEDRALYILENFAVRSGSRDVAKAHRWLGALARASWLARQKPLRPLSAHHRFPQLHALAFSGGAACVPLRRDALLRELAAATSGDLDELAQEYIALQDMLVSSLDRPDKPFASAAENLLAFTTGRVHLMGSRDRFVLWWGRLRPMLMRGGGAALLGARLMQREAYGEAAQLLNALAEGGVLSGEAETLRRAVCFLSLFARPQWRMTSADIPRYFTEGHYYMAAEMGVLRFPTASLPEVVDCCRRGNILRDSKRRLIEDTLTLWEVFGEDLAPQLALLLKRLTEDKGRRCATRLSHWQERWAERKAAFERPTALLMDGVVAVANGKLREAARLFGEVSQLEPKWSLPLVNLVHVELLAGKPREARALASLVERLHPKDGHAFIALGRLLATHLEDSTGAERLFLKAQKLIDPPTEALIRLGEVKLTQGAYMEAQSYFDQARRADPSLPDPRLGLARTYMETKNPKHAIEHLEAVAASGPDEARSLAHYLLYQVYREMGEDRRAFEYLDMVPPGFFKEPEILDDIAGHLESEHQYSKAREYAERAMLLRASGGLRGSEGDALSAL